MKYKNIYSITSFVSLAVMIASIPACAPATLRSMDLAPNSYAEAVEVRNLKRIVFVSGQIPVDDNQKGPSVNFEEQCRVVWDNIKKQLTTCHMDVTDIVKVTTYLADRKYREQNYKVRHEVLGNHSPALTIIITDIYDEGWLVEIEVIAAR